MVVSSFNVGTTLSLHWYSNGAIVVGNGVLGASVSQLNAPFSVALDSLSTLYIADQNNRRVQKWASQVWNGLTIAGQANGTAGATAASLSRAGGLAIDSSGGVYVADMYNCRAQYFSNGASTGTTVAGTGHHAQSILLRERKRIGACVFFCLIYSVGRRFLD